MAQFYYQPKTFTFLVKHLISILLNLFCSHGGGSMHTCLNAPSQIFEELDFPVLLYDHEIQLKGSDQPILTTLSTPIYSKYSSSYFLFYHLNFHHYPYLWLCSFMTRPTYRHLLLLPFLLLYNLYRSRPFLN